MLRALRGLGLHRVQGFIRVIGGGGGGGGGSLVRQLKRFKGFR